MQQDSYDTTYRLRMIPVRKILGLLAGVLAVFILSRVLTYFVLRFDPYYIYVVAIGIVVGVAISQKLELAIIAYAFLAPFVIAASPGFQGTRSGYQPAIYPSQMGLIVLSIVWTAKAFFRGKPVIQRCSFYLPFLSFLFVCTLSVISSFVVWDYDIPQSGRRVMNMTSEVALFALCGVAFWLASSAIQAREWIKPLFWPVLIAGLYAGWVQVFVAGDEPLDIVRSGFMVAFALAMVLARLLFSDDNKRSRRLLTLVFLALLFSEFYNLQWISGWLTSSIAMLIIVGYKSRKTLAAIGIAVFFVLFIYPGVYHDVYSDSRKEGDMDRFILWSDSIRMANSVNPMLGIGPSNYVTYSRKYASVWYGEGTYDYAHSNYAQFIAETGWLGFFAFLWLIFAGIRTGVRSIRKVSQDIRWFTIGATAIFIGISFSSLVGDYLLPSRTNGGLNSFGTSVYVWLLLGASVSAVRLSGKHTDSKEAEAVQEPPAEVLR